MNCQYENKADFTIEVARIETKCKYHKRAGLCYSRKTAVPDGMCPALFYAAYPLCLSVLYSGRPRRGGSRTKGASEGLCACLVPQGVKVKVSAVDTLPAPLRQLKELGEEFLKKFLRPFDLPFRRVYIEMLEKGPACPMDYEAGRRFEFNTGGKKEMCPAGFYSVFPFLEAGAARVHCPDYKGVTYLIKGASEKDFTRAYCSAGSSSLPGNFCPHAFHAARPYIFTLRQGGWFNWVGRGQGVIVNCPAPDGVAFYVKAPSKDIQKIELEVMKEGPHCPKNYRLNQKFYFEAIND